MDGWGTGGVCCGGLETVKAGSLGAKPGWEKTREGGRTYHGEEAEGKKKSGGGILRGSRWKKSEMPNSS